MSPSRKALLWAAGIGLVLDQASKLLAVAQLRPYEPHAVLPYLWWTLVYNQGAAFSLFAELPEMLRRSLLIAAGFFGLGVVAYLSRDLQEKDRWQGLALGLVAAGALGNLVDRLRLSGKVIDFVEVGVRGVYTWPVFNVADSCISIGVGSLVVMALRKGKE